MTQLWVTDSLGGHMYSDELSSTLRHALQPLEQFRQLCDAKDATEKGLHAGENFHWNIYSDVAAQGTTIAETSTMPETNFTITQGTLTVTEYGNSVPFTSKLDNLSKHPVTEVINKVLKHDAAKAFDAAAHAQFNATPLRILPTAGTATDSVTLYTNGTATGTVSAAMAKAHVKAIVDTMKERNILPYIANDYMSIAHPSTFRNFKDELEAIHTYVGADRGLTLIMNGEMGRYENTRFLEQTHIAKNDMTSTYASANTKGAFFFGGDTVAEAICIPEEMRGKIPTDYGRSKGVAWYYLGGFGLVRTAAADASIVAWDTQG